MSHSQQSHCKGLLLCRYIHTEFPAPLMLATWPGLRECSAGLFVICAPACVCGHVRFFSQGKLGGGGDSALSAGSRTS